MLTHVGPRNDVLDGSVSPLKGALLGGNVSVYCNVPIHKCFAPAAGECACSAHAADENAFAAARCDKKAMRPLAKLLWILVMTLLKITVQTVAIFNACACFSHKNVIVILIIILHNIMIRGLSLIRIMYNCRLCVSFCRSTCKLLSV